jgi:hypothetical protein
MKRWKKWSPLYGIVLKKTNENIVITKKKGGKIDLIERILNKNLDNIIKRLESSKLKNGKYYFKINESGEIILDKIQYGKTIIDEGTLFECIAKKNNFLVEKWEPIEDEKLLETISYDYVLKDGEQIKKVIKESNNFLYNDTINIFYIDLIDLYENIDFRKHLDFKDPDLLEGGRFYLKMVQIIFKEYYQKRIDEFYNLGLEIPDFVYKLDYNKINDPDIKILLESDDRNKYLFWILLTQLKNRLKTPKGLLDGPILESWNKMVESIDFISGYSKSYIKDRNNTTIKSLSKRIEEENNKSYEENTLLHLDKFFPVFNEENKRKSVVSSEKYAILVINISFCSKWIRNYINDIKLKFGKRFLLVNIKEIDDIMYLNLEDTIIKNYANELECEYISVDLFCLEEIEKYLNSYVEYVYYFDERLTDTLKLYNKYSIKTLKLKSQDKELKKYLIDKEWDKWNGLIDPVIKPFFTHLKDILKDK